MKKKIRVRFAPSPTGPLHIGGLRTALYNYLFSKKHNGDFILRIEDTDKKRNIKNSINYIIKSLKWCNINYNEGYKNKGKYGPYIQSKRINIYKKYIKILIKKKLAYYSFDKKKDIIKYKKKNKNFIYNSLTRKKLNNSLVLSKDDIINNIKKKKYVIRIKTPNNKNIIFYDKVYGKININTNKIDDKIIFKSNNTPTYHFASVIDDHLMKITHIIRGKEWISSTPIHIIIYNYFKWKIPFFIHLPLILNNNKKGKISKRNINNEFPIYPIISNYKSIKIKKSYEEIGFLPDSLINIIALLGWCPNPRNNKEIYNLKEMIKLFNFKNISKSDVHLNYKKCCWINKKYINKNNKKIQLLIYNKLFKIVKKKIKKYKKKYKNIYIKNVINITKNRINVINDIWNVSYYFFINPKKIHIDKKLIKKLKKNYNKIIIFLQKIKFFFIKKRKKKIIKKFLKKIFKKYKNSIYIKTLRLSIVGKLIGINMLEILYTIKKDKIIKRINNFIKIIK
ncbi:MAG: glutamate--tRNA ligase [Candidatus Shikimatogenerans bostrichidophilus]|nr:MAG: glutamate--tRNA ligase [Candidatus Shikimatogenerans bostrichidophilus]